MLLDDGPRSSTLDHPQSNLNDYPKEIKIRLDVQSGWVVVQQGNEMQQ